MGRHRAAPTLDAGSGASGRAGERGFTLAEMAVTLIVAVEIILATLLLFDAGGKIGKAEMQVSGMQQSLRVGQYEIVRMLRMAGRGGLPVTNSPATTMSANLFAGTALAVRDNVLAGSGVIAGSPPTDPPDFTNPRVLAGTDVLTVRGVFSTPLYQVNYSDATAFQYNPQTGIGRVILSAVSPTGVQQPLDKKSTPGSFQDALCSNPPRPESLILVSPVDDTVYGVAQLDTANSTIDCSDAPPATVTVGFTTTDARTGLSAGGAFPTLNNVAYVGIVEEYRYYVREVHANPSDPGSELNPLLSRARFYAGTDNAWDGVSTNLYQDIGDGVLDLQVALGFDTNPTTIPNYQTSQFDPANVAYLFDNTADNGANPPVPLPALLYVRLNLLARTSRHDVQYRAPLIASIEDHAYSSTPASPLDPNGSVGLTMRRRLSQTVVGMRDRL
jgi:Type IV Pilus-assembly protein W